ncbi:MAG: NAD(P)/FAD-dependent oxidoreductase [Clostridia bacterium]|nr:NAD(P)/FAD-dependent oxidoreductase [Clostridia bacterium]
MAAAAAAQNGHSVTVIERNERPARKILVTGKGRCNVTNNCDVDTLMSNIPRNGRFLYSAFNAFSPQDTISYFENLGVPLKTERGNRVFPVSDKAMDIADALVRGIRKSGVTVINGRVQSINAVDGAVASVRLYDNSEISADRVILATGGLSYPGTGSTGDGYGIAKALGHTVTPLRPSLVPVCIKEGFAARLMGLSLKNVTLTLYKEGKKKPIFTEMGEMLFTHFGISGPLALSASAHIDGLNTEGYECEVDLKPALSEEQLDKRLCRDFSENLNKNFRNALDALLPQKLIPVIVGMSSIPAETKVNQISKEQRLNFVRLLKHLKMTVSGLRPVEEAVITSGGISIKEINSATMESKLIGGLFFAGEIIDVDAYTGGFNLQIAFSTGFLAGSKVTF